MTIYRILLFHIYIILFNIQPLVICKTSSRPTSTSFRLAISLDHKTSENFSDKPTHFWIKRRRSRNPRMYSTTEHILNFFQNKLVPECTFRNLKVLIKLKNTE